LDEGGQTVSGAVLGTPSYMAPEQARGSKEVGPACDVYALGAILYECLSGRPPFKAASAYDTILQVVADEPVPVRVLQPQVPRDLETICHKCLHKEPRRRYASALALAGDLRRFLDGEPIQGRPVGRVERAWRWCRRNRGVTSLLVALGLALVGGLAVLAWAVRERIRADDEKVTRLRADNDRLRVVQEKEMEETRRRQSEASRWEQRAAVAEAEGFYPRAALCYGRALEQFDRPETRARWLAARQRSLVPLATSSRRVLTSTLDY